MCVCVSLSPLQAISIDSGDGQAYRRYTDHPPQMILKKTCQLTKSAKNERQEDPSNITFIFSKNIISVQHGK